MPEPAQCCYGCGARNPRGLQLRSYWDDDEVVATWTPEDHHLAPPGILNGGVIATLIDCHATGAANAEAHRWGLVDGFDAMYVTASLHVDYMKPTPLRSSVTLKGRVEEVGERSIMVTCELKSEGAVCARGKVLAVRADTQRFVRTYGESIGC
ncbi:MAG: PaaI family thioesterase [Candidatus Thorarchaeota archaeon]|nr:MAG: PaaI family thioesterase [Candidatus Thorarchaeota archaeon]